MTKRRKGDFFIGSRDQFLSDVVLPQYEKFKKSNSSIRVAVCSIIVAYHMYEWANGEKFTCAARFAARYPGDASLADSFDVARKVANAVKHADIKIETKAQAGFSSSFGNSFARPLNIVLDDGSRTSVDDLLQLLVGFWEAQQQNGWP